MIMTPLSKLESDREYWQAQKSTASENLAMAKSMLSTIEKAIHQLQTSGHKNLRSSASMVNVVNYLLANLPDEFTQAQVTEHLNLAGYTANRSTLRSALGVLVNEGVIEVVKKGRCKRGTVYTYPPQK